MLDESTALEVASSNVLACSRKVVREYHITYHMTDLAQLTNVVTDLSNCCHMDSDITSILTPIFDSLHGPEWVSLKAQHGWTGNMFYGPVDLVG